MKFRAIPGAFVVFAVGVGCSATSPLPGPLLSGPRLAEQGTLAARLFDEEVRLTYLPLRDNGTTPSNRVLTSDWAFAFRAGAAWLTSVDATMDVARANAASGREVSVREARVLGALAYRAWLAMKTLLAAADLRAAPVLAKLRVATPQELEVLRTALKIPSFDLAAYLALGVGQRMRLVAVIEAALFPSSGREGVSPIPPEVSLDAAIAAARSIGRLVVESPVAPTPVTSPSSLWHVATTAALVGQPAPETALRFELASRPEAPADVIAPRFATLVVSHEDTEVELPSAPTLAVAQARATLASPDATPAALAAANDALVREAFAVLAQALGGHEGAGGGFVLRLPKRLHQAVGNDLRGRTLVDVAELGACDVVIASDCFGAQTTSHPRLPGSLGYDTRTDSCTSERCGPVVDLLAPHARDRAACDACVVDECADACEESGVAVARSAALCARCRPCDEVSCRYGGTDPYGQMACGKGQVGCWVALDACKAACAAESAPTEEIVECVRSTCAEACAEK
jgi:hypothetical protein